MSDLYVEELGAGDRVVLVHGSGPREGTWSDQRPLAERYQLMIPDRRGYGRSPSADPSFEFDPDDVATLLGDGAHLVGTSYGGLSAAGTPFLTPPASTTCSNASGARPVPRACVGGDLEPTTDAGAAIRRCASGALSTGDFARGRSHAPALRRLLDGGGPTAS